jgi:predicted dehydrogenase
METKRIGIIMNGVTGRMGTNQHLIRSILAIKQQGGLKVSDDLTLMPDPILTGRNEDKLRALAQKHGVARYTTNLDAALADPADEIFFDASGTLQRARFVEMAVKARKAVYCEKPTAVETSEALRLAKLCEDAGVKNGVVQDKLWLPGIRKFKVLRDQGFFGKILAPEAVSIMLLGPGVADILKANNIIGPTSASDSAIGVFMLMPRRLQPVQPESGPAAVADRHVQNRSY